MSDYRRFFSYIYSYENGRKISNAGFAKIEMKNSVTSIELHMRNAYLATPAACLYLFVRDESSILGFALGDVPLSNGAADRRFTLTGTQLDDSHYHISDAAGILLISNDSICFASQWDEQPIDWNNFRIYAPPQEAEDSLQEELFQSDASQKESLPEASDNHTELPLSQEKVISSAELTALQQESAPYTFPDQAVPFPSDRETSPLPEAYEEPFDDSTVFIHKKNRSDIDRSDDSSIHLWQKLFDTYPHTHPFENTNIVCVRIELKDLRLLPPQNWHLCNNGFLLHAFFTYRHLLFGKIATPHGDEWFIGVPGIRYKQQHILAAIFGFSNFLPDKENMHTQEPFGYWYTTMIESD